MVILLTGSTGFLGRNLVRAFRQAGHEVIGMRRSGRTAIPLDGDPCVRWIEGDFSRDQDSHRWLERLQGVDAVVNAAGVLRESRQQKFEDVHVRGPCALFSACAEAGVHRVIQISALGADAGATSGYHRSKRSADQHLLGLELSAVVVQPSLLFGPGGASADFFSMLASLPLIPLPGQGGQGIQPLHVDDAVEVILSLLAEGGCKGRLALVGPAPMSLKEFLMTLRQSLGLRGGAAISIPDPVMNLAAKAASWIPGSLLDPDTWSMLQRGNIADPTATRSLLGRSPRSPAQFLGPSAAMLQRLRAQLAWLLPMLRWTLAIVWIVTGVVSLWVFPADESQALLLRSGVASAWAPWLLWGAGLLNLALGVATLMLHWWRPLWLVQAALVLFYTVVITCRLPEFWGHPYGPVLKNIPILGMLLLLHQMSPHRPRR